MKKLALKDVATSTQYGYKFEIIVAFFANT